MTVGSSSIHWVPPIWNTYRIYLNAPTLNTPKNHVFSHVKKIEKQAKPFCKPTFLKQTFLKVVSFFFWRETPFRAGVSRLTDELTDETSNETFFSSCMTICQANLNLIPSVKRPKMNSEKWSK